MKYFIQGKEVTKEEFDIEFDKELEIYKPITIYWPQTKEEVRDRLKKDRYFDFPNSTKCHGSPTYNHFVAVEEEILEISYIVEEAEFDALDGDALPIAVAVWNEGYRKVEK